MKNFLTHMEGETMANTIGKYITMQIEDDFEHYVYVKEMTESEASKILCREWDMTPQEMNDILNTYKKKQNDIDHTNDLGEII